MQRNIRQQHFYLHMYKNQFNYISFPFFFILKEQGRSVFFRSRYAQEAKGKRAPKARAARGVWGHAPPENFYFWGLGNAIPKVFKGEFS